MDCTGTFIWGILCGMIVLPILRALLRFRRKKHVPMVLGASVPLTPHTIDFSRRYNISSGGGFGEDSLRVFEGALIVGYVEEQAKAGGKFYDDWIVAELPDGRKLYLTPQSIRFMEESDLKPRAGVELE